MNKLILLFLLLSGCLFALDNTVKNRDYFDALTKKEREVIVDRGTERAFSGNYVDLFKAGLYVCKACNNPLFESDSKFKSNCGWPSFDDEIENAILKIPDYSMGLKRIEICCSNCSGHLGHIFEGEGYTQKNIRHCVNSLSIIFVKSENY